MARNVGLEFVEAVASGHIPLFITGVKELIAGNPRSAELWLFLARAHEASGDIEIATRCYSRAGQLASGSQDRAQNVSAELRQFAERYGRMELLAPRSHGPIVAKSATQPKSKKAKKKKQLNGNGQKSSAGGSQKKPHSKKRKRSLAASATVKNQLTEVEKAYAAGDRQLDLVLRFGQLLHRDGQGERALEVFQEGLKLHPDPDSRRLLKERTQILSAMGRSAEAAEGYKTLASYETRPAARRFYRMQLALMYRRNKQLDEARRVVDDLLQDDPRDLAVSRLRRSLDQPEGLAASDISDQSSIPEETETPNLFISQLLAHSLEKVEFRDATILAKGGKPDLKDAHRLMKRAAGLEG